MRATARRTTAVLLATSVVAMAPAEEGEVTQEALDALHRFLAVDCEAGEEGAAVAALLEHADELEPELVLVLSEGPREAWVEEFTAALEQRWERRQAFLASNPPLGLGPDAWLAVTATTRDEYMERERQRFETVYRERAAAGLGAIGTPNALQALQQASIDADDELGNFIQSLLARSRAVERSHPRIGDGRPDTRTRAARDSNID